MGGDESGVLSTAEVGMHGNVFYLLTSPTAKWWVSGFVNAAECSVVLVLLGYPDVLAVLIPDISDDIYLKWIHSLSSGEV